MDQRSGFPTLEQIEETCPRAVRVTLEMLREEVKDLRTKLAIKDKDESRLDWLNEQVVDVIYLDDGRIIDVKGNDVRKAIDTGQALSPNTTEEQRG